MKKVLGLLVVGTMFAFAACTQAAETSEDAVEAVEEVATDAADAVEEAAEDAQEAASDAVDAVEDAVDEATAE